MTVRSDSGTRAAHAAPGTATLPNLAGASIRPLEGCSTRSADSLLPTESGTRCLRPVRAPAIPIWSNPLHARLRGVGDCTRVSEMTFSLARGEIRAFDVNNP